MVDLTLFSSALSAVKTAREIAQLLKETDPSREKAEQKSRLADFLYALAELKSELAEIQHAVIDRDEKIKQLQEALQIKKHIVGEQPYYWLQTNDNKRRAVLPTLLRSGYETGSASGFGGAIHNLTNDAVGPNRELMRDYLLLLLFTGGRPSEAAELKR